MSPTVYLVSGANRGIGLGLVTLLAQRPDVVVFGTARDPVSATQLNALAEKHAGKVHVVKLVASDEAGNRAAIAEVKAKAGRLDVVIANAGIANYYGTILDTPINELRDHFEVNTVGTLVLFQAAYPLLKESTPAPKFVIVSSTAGSITATEQVRIQNGGYGQSKTAVNYIARKIHFEHPELVIFPICPGGVATDMGAAAQEADEFMRAYPLNTVEQTATGILKQTDAATRESVGGKFINWAGDSVPW